MKPLPHEYTVQLVAEAEPYATLGSTALPPLSVAPPPDYGGPGDVWSPEHLLLAAVQACFLFTLRAVSRASKVAFRNVRIDTLGTVDKRDGTVRFTDIVLRCRVTTQPGVDRERALRVLTKAEKACLISASLTVPVRLEAEVQEEEVQPAVCAA